VLLADPSGYGRILRDASGVKVLGIVEHKDATRPSSAPSARSTPA
jgi:bifunctional UDP-N-acetylglucosamine pyrophosphorylase/glucosamine-1-phosphate N-acetyltransferase